MTLPFSVIHIQHSHIVIITCFFFEAGLLQSWNWPPTCDPPTSNSAVPGLQMCTMMCVSYMQFATCIYRYKLKGSESHYVEGNGHVPSLSQKYGTLHKRKPALSSLFHLSFAFCSCWIQSEGSQLLPWQGCLQEIFPKRTAWPQETTTLQKSKGAGVQGKYVYLFLWHLTCPLLFAETGTTEMKCWCGAETMEWKFHSLQYYMNGTLPSISSLVSSWGL